MQSRGSGYGSSSFVELGIYKMITGGVHDDQCTGELQEQKNRKSKPLSSSWIIRISQLSMPPQNAQPTWMAQITAAGTALIVVLERDMIIFEI